MANILKGGIVFKKSEIACSKPRYSGRSVPLKKTFWTGVITKQLTVFDFLTFYPKILAIFS
jgi:hypothetical protein